MGAGAGPGARPPLDPGRGPGWAKLAEAVALRVPPSEIETIYLFRPWKREGREWGTAVVACRAAEGAGEGAGGRLRVYTARYMLIVRGKERGQSRIEVEETALSPAAVIARVMQAAASQPSPWEAVRAGLSTFLDACLDPAFRRIVVLDSVSVLQAKVLEVGIDPVELPMLRTVLTPLLGTATFGGIAVDALTYVALGGLYGASLYIARASNPRAARAEVDLVLDTLIGGLLGGAAR